MVGELKIKKIKQEVKNEKERTCNNTMEYLKGSTSENLKQLPHLSAEKIYIYIYIYISSWLMMLPIT